MFWFSIFSFSPVPSFKTHCKDDDSAQLFVFRNWWFSGFICGLLRFLLFVLHSSALFSRSSTKKCSRSDSPANKRPVSAATKRRWSESRKDYNFFEVKITSLNYVALNWVARILSYWRPLLCPLCVTQKNKKALRHVETFPFSILCSKKKTPNI